MQSFGHIRSEIFSFSFWLLPGTIAHTSKSSMTANEFIIDSDTTLHDRGQPWKLCIMFAVCITIIVIISKISMACNVCFMLFLIKNTVASFIYTSLCKQKIKSMACNANMNFTRISKMILRKQKGLFIFVCLFKCKAFFPFC